MLLVVRIESSGVQIESSGPIVDQAVDAFPQHRDIEVDKRADPVVGHAQGRQELRSMQRQEFFHCL